MFYRVTVVDDQGSPVRKIVVTHRAHCGEGCGSDDVDSAKTNAEGVATLTLGDEEIGHYVQCGPTDKYSWGGARGVYPGWLAESGTATVNVEIQVTALAAQQPAAEPEPEPQDAGPDAAPEPEEPAGTEDEEPEGEGAVHGGHPIAVAHVCGAPCTSKEGTCERHTKNTGGCYQHTGHGGHAEAA